MQKFQTYTLSMGQTLELVSSRMSMSRGKAISGGRNTVGEDKEAGKWRANLRNSINFT